MNLSNKIVHIDLFYLMLSAWSLKMWHCFEMSRMNSSTATCNTLFYSLIIYYRNRPVIIVYLDYSSLRIRPTENLTNFWELRLFPRTWPTFENMTYFRNLLTSEKLSNWELDLLLIAWPTKFLTSVWVLDLLVWTLPTSERSTECELDLFLIAWPTKFLPAYWVLDLHLRTWPTSVAKNGASSE